MNYLLLQRLHRAMISLGAMVLGMTVSRADSAVAPGLQPVNFNGQTFIVRIIDPKNQELQLFWGDEQGKPLRDFDGLDKFVSAKGEHLFFAANAGMYEVDSKPVGLLVQGSVEKSPLNLNDGRGNFYMKPNGVFLINDKREALIVDSNSYGTLLNPVLWATQSGPLLVHGGDINPDFNANSQSKKIRSGVGVTKQGTVIFVLSKAPVTFYDFASFFLVQAKCPNALYLDGDVSAFYVPGIKDPTPHSFGPMFGLVDKPGP